MPLPRKPERMISSLRIPSILPCGEEPRPGLSFAPLEKTPYPVRFQSDRDSRRAASPTFKALGRKGAGGGKIPSSEGFPLPSIPLFYFIASSISSRSF